MPIPQADAPTTAPDADPAYALVRVIDGDTVELDYQGAPVKVRVAGIDTPPGPPPAQHHASSKLDRDDEGSSLGRETIRAMGKAATRHAETLLPPGARVHVVDGDGHEATERDRYGRRVGYLDVADDFGQHFDFGARMIGDGYAHEYDGGGRFPHARADDYQALERAARTDGVGLWADGSLSRL